MNKNTHKTKRRTRRRAAIRHRVTGTPERPRLCVYKSLNHFYAQVIDDTEGRTLAAASSLDAGLRGDGKKGGNISAAAEVGRLVAERAKDKGVQKVVFDRGGFKYHGRVKAFAEAARKAGLEF